MVTKFLRLVGDLLLWAAALVVFLAWLGLPLHAQKSNTYWVDQFTGGTVADKTVRAQTACRSDLPCVLIFDTALAQIQTGAMPSRGANETWVDYRSGFSVSPFSVGPLNGVIKGDGKQLLNVCNISSGSAVVTCSGSVFTSADVGKLAAFALAGVAGAYLNTTILSYQSATQVTLAASASATVTNGTFWYGTDNTAAWCAAMNCTSTTVPTQLFSPFPGREIVVPAGTYLFSGTIHTRNGDYLQGLGQQQTQFVLLSNTNNLNQLCLTANASAGVNTCTVDAGGLGTGVEGILFATPENSTQVSINTTSYSGWSIKNNWFESGIAISNTNGNIGQIVGNTFDSGTLNGVNLKGDGTDVNNPCHSILIEGNQFFLNSFQIGNDGCSSVQIRGNDFLYPKNDAIYTNSGTSQNTYRMVIDGNNFQTSTSASYYVAGQDHISLGTNCIRCQIVNNKFYLSRNHDIEVTASGSVGLTISGNEFYGGQGDSVAISVALAGLTMSDNKWDTPGNHALLTVSGGQFHDNYVTSPFAVAGTPGTPSQNGAMSFNGAVTNIRFFNNWTDSTTSAVGAFYGGPTLVQTGGNRSAWATADTEANTSCTSSSWNERFANAGCGTTGMMFIDPTTGKAMFSSFQVGASGANISDSRTIAQFVATLTTTAAASDNVSITGVTAGSKCSMDPTNASAATNISTTYISAKASNQITVTHAVTAGMTYDILCSAQ